LDATYETTNGQSFDADLEAIDLLISGAAAAIDDGDHYAALDGFRQALGLARSCFGENTELAELENAIEDIDGMLLENDEISC